VIAALLLNVVAAGVLLWLADGWLRERGGNALWGLVALVLATPLPFVAALGMEHVAQLAAVVWLLRARSPGEVAAAAAVATGFRYEGAFVAFWLGVVLATERRWAHAAAAWAGAAAVVGGFGLFSVAQGGFLLPNSLLMKSTLRTGWWDGLVETFGDGGVVLALAAAVAVVAARRDAAIYVLAALTHLALARVGWLYRYEAWLVGWGVLLLAPLARPLLLVAIGLPLGVRAVEATWRYPAGARHADDVDVRVAEWVARDWPGATVATHDLGAMSFLTDATLVDVAGLGTTAITRLYLDDALTPDAVAAICAERGVTFAITGPDWNRGRLPPSFRRAATLVAPYPDGPGEFETVIWSVDPAVRPRLLRSLAAARGTWPERVRVEVPDAEAVPLEAAAVEGPAVKPEDGGLSFYTNGRASIVAPIAGTLRLTARGTLADGRGPRFVVIAGETRAELEAGEADAVATLGRVAAGDTIAIVYDDDHVDAAGHDRNLFVREVVVRSD
jgi:hypothetical protein